MSYDQQSFFTGVEILDTTQSLSLTTGALTISGGLGVVGNTFLNNTSLVNTTVTNLIGTNSNVTTGTIGTLISGFISVTNIANSNTSISNLVNTTATVGTLISGFMSVTNIDNSNTSISNLVNTTATVGTLRNTDLISTNSTITNSVITTSTVGTLRNTGLISTNSTITNSVLTTSTVGTLRNTDLISTNANVTNGTIGTLISGFMSVTNIDNSNTSISNLVNTTSTVGTLRNTDLISTNTIITNANVTTSTVGTLLNSNLIGTNTTVTNAVLSNANVTTSTVGTLLNTNASMGIMYVNNSAGIMLNGADRPMITRGFDPFLTGNFAGAGRWGLFMEGGATTLGIPAGGSGRRHQFVSYNDDSTINTTYMTILESGNVGIGTATPSSTLEVNGSLAKSSGTFDIQHPVKENKRLIHSFIEGPRCDLIYRGNVTLINGQAFVDLNKNCVSDIECAMSDGTFESLCDNPQYLLQNHTSFSRVKGNINGCILTIECEDSNSTDTIYWTVIAERKDAHIKQWSRTNVNGYLITEY